MQFVNMRADELKALRESMAPKKRKAKSSSATPKRVKFIEPEAKEAFSEPSPTKGEVASDTPMALPPCLPIPQSLLPSILVNAILEVMPDSKTSLRGRLANVLP